MGDSIFLENLEFFARHGVHGCEHGKSSAQKFSISLRIWGNFSVAMRSDNVADTIDYSAVYDIVKVVVEDNEFHLIERLAAEIAACVLGKFSKADTVEISVKKYPSTWESRKYGSVGFSARFSR